MRFRVLCGLLFFGCSSCLAQPSDATPTLRSEVRLAHANAIVIDKRTRAPIEGLEASDFHVFDNGVEQKLTHFGLVGKDDRPLALVILVSRLYFNSDLVRALPEAVSRMAAKLRPGDRIALIGYGTLDENCQDRVSKDDISPFNPDPALLLAMLQRFTGHADVHARCKETLEQMKLDAKQHPQPSVDFFGVLEATTIATDLLAGQPYARPEIIAFTDDFDFALKEVTDPLLERLQERDITVNSLERAVLFIKTMKFFVSVPSKRMQSAVIEHYANETGGLILSPAQDKFDDALEDLLLGIRAEYDLAWKVPASASDHHTIRIELKNHKRATLRTRTAYSTRKSVDPNSKD